jgi:peptidoglycan/LPS O-acetylase OafA/YrhL
VEASAVATANRAASSLPYMPGLDVARGVAILMVILDHGLATNLAPYLAHTSTGLRALEFCLRFGHMGVHLFFILSGFLITSILLHTRDEPGYFSNFYARRALRILPAYLLMLGVLVATHTVTARYIAVCLLFLCNMPSVLGCAPEYSPLWSLSVEEQFYLVWPMVVRRLSIRALSLLCAAVILLTPLLRFTLLYGPPAVRDVRFKTWAVADFFAAGALLAIAARLPHLRPLLRRLSPWLLVAGLILSAAQQFAPYPTGPALMNVYHAAFLEPWLIGLSGFVMLMLLHPPAASGVHFRPLIFLAKISYGLYLCHVFLFSLVNRVWQIHSLATIGVVPQVFVRFVLEAALSIAVATLSRTTVEAFFLRLKPKLRRSSHTDNIALKIT